jgi:hypothetical protein
MTTRYHTISETATIMRTNRNRVYELMRQSDDPIPFFQIAGKKRWLVAEKDLKAWIKRNTCYYERTA